MLKYLNHWHHLHGIIGSLLYDLEILYVVKCCNGCIILWINFQRDILRNASLIIKQKKFMIWGSSLKNFQNAIGLKTWNLLFSQSLNFMSPTKVDYWFWIEKIWIKWKCNKQHTNVKAAQFSNAFK